MSVLLEMRGIRKSFYGNEVLHSVDLTLEAGTVISQSNHSETWTGAHKEESDVHGTVRIHR